VNRHLIEGLARVGEGEPFVALNAAEARSTAARFLEYIQSPLLTRVEVRTPGFDAYDLEPARVPDLFAERPLVLAGKYRGPAAGEIVITGFTGQGRFERRIKVDGARGASNDILKVLWARERLTLLSDLAIGGGPDAGRRQEVTSLGLKYGLLTEFTSFVAVDQRVRRQDGRVETVKQPLPLPQGVTDLAVGGGPGPVRAVAAESVMLHAAPYAPRSDPRDAAKTNAGAAGRLVQGTDEVREERKDAVRVEVVESRLTGTGRWIAGSGQWSKALTDAVAGAAGPTHAASAGGVRMKVIFNARGEVDRVEPLGAPTELARRVREALRSFRLQGATGGWLVIAITWR